MTETTTNRQNTEALQIDDLQLDDVEVAVEEGTYALPEAGASVSPKYSCSVVINNQ